VPAKKRKRRPYHHGDLRRALIEEAVSILKTEGESALTLRDLSRRLGVSHAAPLYHFPDKTELLLQLSLDGFKLLADALARAHASDGPPGERLIAVGRAYLRFALENPVHFRMMFRALPPGVVQGPALLAERDRAYRTLIEAVDLLVPAGAPDREVESRKLAFTAWSLVHGAAALWLDGSMRVAALTRGQSFEDFVTEAMSRLMSGLPQG